MFPVSELREYLLVAGPKMSKMLKMHSWRKGCIDGQGVDPGEALDVVIHRYVRLHYGWSDADWQDFASAIWKRCDVSSLHDIEDEAWIAIQEGVNPTEVLPDSDPRTKSSKGYKRRIPVRDLINDFLTWVATRRSDRVTMFADEVREKVGEENKDKEKGFAFDVRGVVVVNWALGVLALVLLCPTLSVGQFLGCCLVWFGLAAGAFTHERISQRKSNQVQPC